MKNASLIFNIVLIACIALLFVLHFTSSKKIKPESKQPDKVLAALPSGQGFAFINVDTLLNKYNLYKELETKLVDRQKSLEGELNRKVAAFEKEAQEFQVKVQNNSFISAESAQMQQEELMQKQQSLLQMKDELSMQLMKEGQAMEKQLLDTVVNFLKIFNQDKKYRYIFNSATFLFADESDNITDTIVNALNARNKTLKKK